MPMAIAMHWNYLTITCDGYRANFHLYLLKILIFERIFYVNYLMHLGWYFCYHFHNQRLVNRFYSIPKMFLIHFVILRGMGTKSRYYREWGLNRDTIENENQLVLKHISLGCFSFFAKNVKKIIFNYENFGHVSLSIWRVELHIRNNRLKKRWNTNFHQNRSKLKFWISIVPEKYGSIRVGVATSDRHPIFCRLFCIKSNQNQPSSIFTK